jgi:hypothetical protein
VERRRAQPWDRTIAVVGVGGVGADVAEDRTTAVVEVDAVGTGTAAIGVVASGVVASGSIREDLRSELI